MRPGARIGAYEVRTLLGRGGMGEVYRARDARLNRDVAIKILPAAVASDPGRLARFRREAQMLGALNHPNIAAIYGFEETGHERALVLELVEGPTLADRIAQGPVPLDEALPIATQIAHALESAHAQGIVHRDLKPANIKVRPDGTVKVLDFGLAKAMSDDPTMSAVTESPTITNSGTLQGVILGTAAYMSPEQARGRPADRRSDIWAFGGVLYEMATGRRAFAGDDVSETLASVLKSDPDWRGLGRHPPAFGRVVKRCLEKDPKRRYHDIADVRLDLEASSDAAAPVAIARSSVLERLAWVLVTAALAGTLAYVWPRPQPPPRAVRFLIAPPATGSFGMIGGVVGAAGSSGAALSPDGTRLVFAATDSGGAGRLWLRPLDAFTARPLVGTDGASLPFWSPDSRSVGFFVEGQLRRIDVASGVSQAITAITDLPWGASWGTGGVVVFSSGTPAQLFQVPAGGGRPARLATARTGDQGTAPVWPQFLPDGRHFLYWTRTTARESSGISLGSIEPGATPRFLLESETQALYAAPGTILFTRDGVLMRQRFDLERLEPAGEPAVVAEQVFRNASLGLGDFTASQSGVLAYRSGAARLNQFAWIDRTGRQLESVGPPGSYRTPALSPDGTRLVYTDVNDQNLWILDLVRRTLSRFTSTRGLETSPVWSPDGRRIAYRADLDRGGVYEKDISGATPERLLLNQSVNAPSQFSSDGSLLLYFAPARTGSSLDLYVLPLAARREPRAIFESPAIETEPQLSPDGRWLAYASPESGRYETYVQPFPPTGARWQVSTDGGRQPLWRADGKELYFVSSERRFYALQIRASGTTFDYGSPEFLFEMKASVFNARNSYIPDRDGRRFLVNTVLDTIDMPIHVVQNWSNP